MIPACKNLDSRKVLISAMLFLFFQLNVFTLFAQKVNDTIVVRNGDKIISKILGMENNRLRIDASYGYGEWEVKWHNVISIQTVNAYNIQLSSGERYFGKLHTLPSGKVLIQESTGDSSLASIDEIVFLLPIKTRFIDKLEGSISLGFNMAKARNLRSVSTQNSLRYRAKNFLLGLTYNGLASIQSETDLIQRSDAAFSYAHDLPKQYFIYFSTSALSNTEQRLALRWNTQFGAGKILFTNIKLDWRLLLGINNNFEQFYSDTENRESIEALLGTHFEIFNIGALKLNTDAKAYYSLTESDRFRTDFKIDLRYNIKYLKKTDLTNKLFVAISYSANYDNKPAKDASELDYVFTTTIGLSWNE